MRAIWKRRGRCLMPASEEAEKLLRRLGEGGEALGDFKIPRSLRQLRLYWAIMAVLVEHGIFATDEAASSATKIELRHVDVVVTPHTGQIHLCPKHINFASMKQSDFDKLFTAAINVVCELWIPMDADDLRQHVFRMVDGPERSSLGRRVA